MSPPEARLWNVLRTAQFKPFHFRRQGATRALLRGLRQSPRAIGHRSRRQFAHDRCRNRLDRRRDAFVRSQDYRVLRFTTLQVLNEIDEVIGVIRTALEEETR
jgi:very-short-patch-repair endonuclease